MIVFVKVLRESGMLNTSVHMDGAQSDCVCHLVHLGEFNRL